MKCSPEHRCDGRHGLRALFHISIDEFAILGFDEKTDVAAL
jgi:hypothetical protein